MVTLLSELGRFRTNEKYKRDGWIPLRPNPCYMSTCRIRFRSPFAKKRERERKECGDGGGASATGIEHSCTLVGIIFRVFLDLRRTIVQFQADLRALNIAWIIHEFNRKFAGSQQSYCIRKSVL